MKQYSLFVIPLFLAALLSGLLFNGKPALVAQAPPPAPPAPTRITVAFTGDVLMHISLVNAARTADGAYDFAPMFAPIAPYLKNANYTVANLETRLAGAKRGYTGYPCFNSPDSLAPALRDAGVDMLATANNHSLDKGADGLLTTLTTLDANKLAHVGTFRTPEEQATPILVDINGVKVAFLNYAEMTNGIPIPAGKSYVINMIGDGQGIIKEATAAKAHGADLVIAFLHFGTEYQRQPNDNQQLLAKKLLANGVDAVIGAHPHVVQPIKRVTVKRSDVPYTGYVIYSMGNFVSGQRDRYRDSGIMVYLDIEKSVTATIVTGVRYLPVYVQRGVLDGRIRYRVLPLVPGEKVQSDVPLTAADIARMKQISEELDAHLDRPAEERISSYRVPAT